MIPYGVLIRWGAALALLGLLCGGLVKCGFDRGVASGESKARAALFEQAKAAVKVAQDNQKAAEDQRDRYQQRAEAQEAVAAQYLQGLNDANRKGDRLAADVRAGDVRFRKLWAQCQTVPASGEASAGASAPDGVADDRAASAGRIVRAAAQCDAQVKALQAILLEERK